MLAVQIRVVFELPPSASFRKNVSFELRNGTWGKPFVKALIHEPK